MKLNVALVDEEVPFPPISGKRIRILNLLRALAPSHNITLVAHRNPQPDEVSEGVRHLRSLGIETVLVSPSRAIIQSRRRRIGFGVQLAKSLFSPLPFSAALHQCQAMVAAVKELHTRQRVDLWQCEWAPYSNYLFQAGVGPTFFMAHDIQTCIWQRYVESESSYPKREYLKRQARKYHEFERRVFSAIDQSATVTEEDANRVEDMFHAARPIVIDNGVDLTFNHPSHDKRNRNEVLFMGSLDWPANQDAVRSLIHRIIPAVQKEFASVELTVVGRNPPSSLEQEIKHSSFAKLFANVPDVRPYLRRCSLLAVPLRIGGGSRLKILEALATQTPVVSTLVGAEGLRLVSGRHFFGTESIDEMAPAIVDCLRNPTRARKLTQSGFELTTQEYDWKMLAEKMEMAWRSLVRPTNLHANTPSDSAPSERK